MAHGKSIELFLIDGELSGVVAVEMSNWNARAIKIPRTKVKKPGQEHIAESLKQAGVYFLFCPKTDGLDEVYVGEGEDVHKRLCDHLRDYASGKERYYWNYAIALVSPRLNKAHIRYLEAFFRKKMIENRRCKNLTQRAARKPILSPSQEAMAKEFAENARSVLYVLGSWILEPQPTANRTDTIFTCKSRNASAQGFLSSGGFTVQAGAKTSETLAPSFEPGNPAYFKLRKRLERDGTIRRGIFTRNCEFASPSAASSVVLGRNSTGKRDWKTADGKPLSEF